MRTHDFLLLAMDTMGGTVRGKTLLQKRLYFLGLLTSRLPELGYTPYYYGPYSETLADTAGKLRSVGFLKEESVDFGVVGRSGFEVRRRDYGLTEDGRKVARRLRADDPGLARDIKAAWERIRSAGDLDYMQLSIAAKVYHILAQKDAALSRPEIVATANRLGWQIGPGDIAKAEEFLSKLDLIEFVQASSEK